MADTVGILLGIIPAFILMCAILSLREMIDKVPVIYMSLGIGFSHLTLTGKFKYVFIALYVEIVRGEYDFIYIWESVKIPHIFFRA